MLTRGFSSNEKNHVFVMILYVQYMYCVCYVCCVLHAHNAKYSRTNSG